jgi:hypothetical protein
MISGVYLGEIARLVFHKIAQESDVFGTAVDGLAIPFILRYLHTRILFSEKNRCVRNECYGNKKSLPCLFNVPWRPFLVLLFIQVSNLVAPLKV